MEIRNEETSSSWRKKRCTKAKEIQDSTCSITIGEKVLTTTEFVVISANQLFTVQLFITGQSSITSLKFQCLFSGRFRVLAVLLSMLIHVPLLQCLLPVALQYRVGCQMRPSLQLLHQIVKFWLVVNCVFNFAMSPMSIVAGANEPFPTQLELQPSHSFFVARAKRRPSM